MPELRPATVGDAALVAELRSRYAPDPVSEQSVRVDWSSPGFELERDARIGAGAYAAAVRLDDERTWIELHGEQPAELLSWALGQMPSGRVLSGGWEGNTAVLGALEAVGFGLVRHSYRMAIGIEDAVAPPTLPPGLELRSLLAGEERAVYETHMETFEDSWEHVREPYTQWSHMLVERPEFEPGLWLLAVDGDRIAGIALSMIQQHQPTTGRIMIVGVRRERRRQGLGESLLRASFAALSARGCRRAILGVDAESLTGAHRLYERAGMHVVARYDVYERG